MRVIKLSRVEIYKFPLADPPSQFNGLATDDENMIADVRLELEDQDAKPVREPEPTTTIFQCQSSLQSWLVGFS